MIPRNLAPNESHLNKLIELKRKLTRPKDKLMLMQLEAVRDELAKARRE
ncbi:MAG TPA: hypothetical protein VHV51_03075 [Polyangiaceae bacterium]|jgi:hypothetical protein|nr:hypothetical protein [Polyangiaceae bacterium]